MKNSTKLVLAVLAAGACLGTLGFSNVSASARKSQSIQPDCVTYGDCTQYHVSVSGDLESWTATVSLDAEHSATQSGLTAGEFGPYSIPAEWEVSTGDSLSWLLVVDRGSYAEEYSGQWEATNCPPTSVIVTEFTSAQVGPTIRLSWATASEIDVLGFNLYRSTPGVNVVGHGQKINPSLIPVKNPGSPTGSSYEYFDLGPFSPKSYTYWLEGIDVFGSSNWYGPQSVNFRVCLSRACTYR